MNDTYKTAASPSEEILYKEKNSKFFGYVYPLTSEEELKPILDALRKQHHGAVHFCYAFQLGTSPVYFRANDDGEPSNTAGMPIYGQIQSYGVTNILVVVVRFFGGVKLGVGGLISAYRTAAQMALEATDIVEKTIDIRFKIDFEYKNMNKVMRIVKEKNLTVVTQQLQESCALIVETRKSQADAVFESFNSLFEVEVERV